MSGVYTIPPDHCFVTTLARGLWTRANRSPLALADMIIFLPTRRACRHLREAFLRVTEARAALLPRLKPLGDVDEDLLDLAYQPGAENDDLPPAINPLRRLMLLIRCVRAKEPSLPMEQAAALAGALADLLDQAQTEGRDLHDLANIVPDFYAKHWQETLAFLEILMAQWPAILAQEGALDPVERRTMIIDRQAAAWISAPPAFPVIAAGSTGSHPAVGRLMAAIARLPQGEVILPGLDISLDEESWQALTDTHPQATMAAWLDSAGVKRRDVGLWDGCAKNTAHSPRVTLLREAMRPAATTDQWRSPHTRETLPAECTQGLEVLTLDNPREEAEVIALRLRAVLEEDGQTAALVTPDRALAARVEAALARWGVTVNDSAGQPLTQTPLGSFFLHVLAAAKPTASPIHFLSLLKHPLTTLSMSQAACRSFARATERALWRGVRVKDGWQGAALAARHAGFDDLASPLSTLASLFAPLTTVWDTPRALSDWLEAHIVLAEALAESKDEDGASRLWRGEAGTVAASWLQAWREAAADMPPLTGPDYAALFETFSRQNPVRPRYGLHPRLSLLGPLEARLIHHDLVILAGLNEDTWPPAPPIDPWLSRPMRTAFGLPSPERRVGLSAHDFAQLAAAPRVLLTRARRQVGTTSVPSRFWLQLHAALHAAGHDAKTLLSPSEPWAAWACALDQPDRVAFCTPPEPRPPLALRPNKLSVTEIATLRRNPYAIYAKHVLGLTKLEPVDADVSAADLGEVVHAALESFVHATRKDWPGDALDALLTHGRAAFTAYADRPEMAAFWWPRFERMATWFVANETARREAGIHPALIEGEGLLVLANGTFTLRGRADRIDRLPSGALSIIDYKTGRIPSGKDQKAGYEPQLALLAIIAEHGGFDGLAPAPVEELAYWALSESEPKKRVKTFTDDLPAHFKEVRRGLETLITHFADPRSAYRADPRPTRAATYNDYAHLARMAEWGRVKEGKG